MTKRTTETPSVDRFRASAVEFCRAIDERDTYTTSELLRCVQPLLAALSEGAMLLPEIGASDLPPPTSDRHDDWKIVFESLAKQLGQYDLYWELYDPYERSDPVQGSLADALADVYMGLSDGLRIWDAAETSLRRSVVWEWRFGFETHWGHHATDAMRAIHALLFTHYIDASDATLFAGSTPD